MAASRRAPTTSPPPASELVALLWKAIDERAEERVAPLVHPEASLEMAMASGRPVEGREAVLTTLREAWTHVHSVTASEVHELGADAAIVVGRSRHPLPEGGFADSQFVWLCEWRSGMLWRQRLFRTLDEARAAAAADQTAKRRRDAPSRSRTRLP